MKYISIALTILLAGFLAVSNQAQNHQKPAKAKPSPPAKPDTVTATPVVEGDPITKPDNRVVRASPVIEGDPMVPEDRITIEELKAKVNAKSQVVILDVRSKDDWNASTTKIKGAIRVLPEEVEKKMLDWKKTQEIVAYCSCSDDSTSLRVTQTLKKAGFQNVKALWGGWHAWEQESFPTELKEAVKPKH